MGGNYKKREQARKNRELAAARSAAEQVERASRQQAEGEAQDETIQNLQEEFEAVAQREETALEPPSGAPDGVHDLACEEAEVAVPPSRPNSCKVTLP
eukprot:CAMPEP_0197918430 /NCGR_PEP_ID=MMETSP1439-20131203/85424_1 /TAXON_ID=66791 /ORGANISM="Gonyaulax spinifera, Strain CCMP409" /LENGTH=97 /DNA_ID=CAMNT_0043540549 /DNA_START=54 /DNA_END=343 /DNA_ORIENTATION=-